MRTFSPVGLLVVPFLASVLAAASAAAQPAGPAPAAASPVSAPAAEAISAPAAAPPSATTPPVVFPAPPVAPAVTAHAGPPDWTPRARLALHVENAVAPRRAFENQIAGARFDLRFSDRTSAGLFLGYANLKGKQGRAHNFLPLAQIEYALPISASLRLPLRFATGYLPRNGPIVRLATGLAWALSPSIDLVGEILTPTIWVTNKYILFSSGLSLEVAIKL